MIARAGGTRRPFTTCSRMRASSSRLAWMASKRGASAVTVPLSTSITRFSSSWLRSPIGMMPAMRAPPLRVCSGRLSPRRRSWLFGCARQSASARSEASMSSVASSVKMAATSGSKSTGSSGASSVAAGAAAAFSLRAGRGDALVQALVGALDALEQLPVVDEVAGGFIQVRGHRLHRRHAVPEEPRSSSVKSHAAAEAVAQPVIERLGEADAVARLRHLGAARERMTGAIDLLGQRVRAGQLRLARQVRAHGGDVRGGLACVDVAQRVIRDLGFGWRRRTRSGCGRAGRCEGTRRRSGGGRRDRRAARAGGTGPDGGLRGLILRDARVARAAGRERVGARGDRHEIGTHGGHRSPAA